MQLTYFQGDFFASRSADQSTDLWTIDQYRKFYDDNLLKQTMQQHSIVNEIMNSANARHLERLALESKRSFHVDDQLRRLFFITGDGGTGKTFTYNVYITFITNYQILLIFIANNCRL